MFKILPSIIELTENQNYTPEIEYDGEIEPVIHDIIGQPYSMYFNDTDSELPNSITITISSEEDDGIVWELPLGEPVIDSFDKYEDMDDEQGGYEVQWKRDHPRDTVKVYNQTNNDPLRQDPMINGLTNRFNLLISQLVQSGNLHEFEKNVYNACSTVVQQWNQKYKY